MAVSKEDEKAIMHRTLAFVSATFSLYETLKPGQVYTSNEVVEALEAIGVAVNNQNPVE